MSKRKNSQKIEKSIELGGEKLTLSTGHVAGQASAAVLASYGETVVLVTAVSSPQKEDWGYFPLMVEYRERLYAGGRIKGSRWVKREGRPSESEILTARFIDRSIRPLFSESYKEEVQIIATVLSVDLENNPDIVSAIATLAALAISPIPWSGPVGIVRVGIKDGTYFTNPKDSELSSSNMDLVVTSRADGVIMIEGMAREVTENEVLGAISYAQGENRKIIDFINAFSQEVGNKKQPLAKEVSDTTLQSKIKKLVAKDISGLIEKIASKKAGVTEYEIMKQATLESLSDKEQAQGKVIFDKLFDSEARKLIFSGKRPDGRKPEEIRRLRAEVEILPRTHGSAIFSRGKTQALSVVTLGSPSLEQLIESAEGEETKRYIHHYSMPPYSLGETGRLGWPSRREIGHGALAEKALLPVIPSEEKFPYTVRVVSEILSSNGSTSMAAVCGSTLALMDAGVPIKCPVSGLALGLVIKNEKEFIILSDITGLEDKIGDMDFKIAGTEKGITALQMDVKTLHLTLAMLEKALDQAKKGRLEIFKVLAKAISKPRLKVSDYAPKIKVIKVPQDKLGEIIGPGGRIIRKIIAETGAQIDVEDEGKVNISAMSDEKVKAAAQQIEALTKEIKAGEIYEGEVKRIQPFGAFVEILPGKEGLVHVSDMSDKFVDDPSKVVKIGDRVKVRVKEIDNLGRINLSMMMDASRDRKRRDQRKGGFTRSRPRSRTKSSSGPHFPTSRFLQPKPRGRFRR